MIRVVAVDDHHLVRQGICRLLTDAEDIEIVGEANNGQEALAIVSRTNPHVVVMDISMPLLNGIDTLVLLRAASVSTQVVMLSMHGDASIVQQALRDGAIGYVLKHAAADELIAAVRAANHGSMYLSSGVSQVLAGGSLSGQGQAVLDRLSPREREVVTEIVAGHSTREIADRLRTSIKTVEKQRRDAMRKLGVSNLASLVRTSLELGISSEQRPRHDECH